MSAGALGVEVVAAVTSESTLVITVATGSRDSGNGSRDSGSYVRRLRYVVGSIRRLRYVCGLVRRLVRGHRCVPINS
jgi:hypothetical protein